MGNEIRLEEGNVGIENIENGEMTCSEIAFVCREESGNEGAVGGNVSDNMSSEDEYFSNSGYDEEEENAYHQKELPNYKIENKETGLAVDSWTNCQHEVRYVKVRTLTGKEYGVVLKGSATVGDLKRDILNETGFSVSDQRLCFSRRLLGNDNSMLYKEGLEHESTVHVVLKLQGAAKTKRTLASERERIFGARKRATSSKRAVYRCDVDTDESSVYYDSDLNETDRRPGDDNTKRFKFCDDVVDSENNFKALVNFYSDVYCDDRGQRTTNQNRIVKDGGVYDIDRYDTVIKDGHWALW